MFIVGVAKYYKTKSLLDLIASYNMDIFNFWSLLHSNFNGF